MNLAIMLASREHDDGVTAAGIARAAAARGHRVSVFLMGDGVHSLDLGTALASEGISVSLCEADAALRDLHKTGQTGVFFGSLYDWARLAEDADRIVSLA